MSKDKQKSVEPVVKDSLQNIMDENADTNLCFKCPCCHTRMIPTQYDPRDNSLTFLDLKEHKD